MWFETGDNGNEYFKWRSNGGGTTKDLMTLKWDALNILVNAVINGNLGIGTTNALGGKSIVIGDNDTGFKQNGDGNLDVYANSVHVMRFVSGSIQSNKTINITGRVNPSDYGNFDSRYVKDVRLGARVVQLMARGGRYEKAGHAITGLRIIGEVDGDDEAIFRPIQKYINGKWYNVAQV